MESGQLLGRRRREGDDGMSKLMERLTFANVMSVVAVFIAIGGGAYAAGLAKDSVKSKQIAANAVKEPELACQRRHRGQDRRRLRDDNDEIADDAVNGAKVNEGSLAQVPLAAVATKASNTLGAIVNSDGSLSSAAQSGTTSTRNGLNTGNYTVGFGRDLAGCAAVAALGNNLGNIPNPGEIGASINFDDTVIVQTRNSAGARDRQRLRADRRLLTRNHPA